LDLNLSYIQYFKDNHIFTNVDTYGYIPYTTNDNANSEEVYKNTKKNYQKLYDQGYRFAVGNEPSQIVYSAMISFLEDHPDFLYFNTASTVDFSLIDPTFVSPGNMVRTCYNDTYLTQYLLDTFLTTKIVDTLKITKNPLFTNVFNDSLKTSTQKYNFQKIVYLYYKPTTYSSGYLKSLQANLPAYDSTSINLQSFDLTNVTSDTFPSDLDALLTQNPVSRYNSFQTNDKTLFFMVTGFPQEMLDLFQKPQYYDNVFIFGNPFSYDGYSSRYLFHYGFIPVGTYSFHGYNASKFVDDTQQLSPIILSMYDVLNYTSTIYQSYPDDLPGFLKELGQTQYLIGGTTWFERKIITYNTTYNSIYHFNEFQVNPFLKANLFYHYGFNDLSTGSIVSGDQSEYLTNDSKSSDAVTFLDYKRQIKQNGNMTTEVINGYSTYQQNHIDYGYNYVDSKHGIYYNIPGSINGTQYPYIDTNVILNAINYVILDYNTIDKWNYALKQAVNNGQAQSPGVVAMYCSTLRNAYGGLITLNFEFEIDAYFPPGQTSKQQKTNYAVFEQKNVNVYGQITTNVKKNGNWVPETSALNFPFQYSITGGDITNGLEGGSLSFSVEFPITNDETNQPSTNTISINNVQLVPSTPASGQTRQTVTIVCFNKGNIGFDNNIYRNYQASEVQINLLYTTNSLSVNYQIGDVINVKKATNSTYDNTYAVIQSFSYNPLSLHIQYLSWSSSDPDNFYAINGAMDLLFPDNYKSKDNPNIIYTNNSTGFTIVYPNFVSP